MNIYEEKGFKDREAYLHFLSEKYGFDYNLIVAFSNILGADQDFIKLVEVLELAASTRDEYDALFENYEDDDEEDFDWFDIEEDEDEEF